MTLDYKSAGVDKEAGYETVNKIKSYAAATHNARVIGQIGAFGALYDLSGYQNPVLVSGTDGIGTKLKIAFAMEKYDTVGIDAVAMCVNDILCHGAQPQFFLDYLACGKLSPDIASEIIKGIAQGCTQSSAALIGGETAEMPGFYQAGEYDVAGFSVGVVEKENIIDGSKVKAGDTIIGIASSGFHSNGFSLLRKVFPDLNQKYGNKTIGEILLTPTKIYVKSVLAVLNDYPIHGMAHITGGGLPENLPRAYGTHLTAHINKQDLPDFPLKNEVMKQVSEAECFDTFNMGIGFVIISDPKDSQDIIHCLEKMGEHAFIIGEMKQAVHSNLVIS